MRTSEKNVVTTKFLSHSSLIFSVLSAAAVFLTRTSARMICILLFWIAPMFVFGGTSDPIALYLTWQHSPETTITIHWITDAEDKDDSISYRSSFEDTMHPQMGSHQLLPDSSPYFLHRVELTRLNPGQEYLFRLGDAPTEYKFMTMPSQLDQPIRFVVGGDMYHDDIKFVHMTNRQAARTSPHFALVGGDIAYASGKFSFSKENRQRWLDWLKAWKDDMVTPEGRLIPIIAAIGNHDVNGGYGQSYRQAGFYYNLFLPSKEVSYQATDFGDYLTILSLDTEHTSPIGGAQTKWLKKTLQEREAITHKIAFYHVPVYPSVRSDHNIYCMEARKNWVPLFEKYGLHIAFENHDHTYKRTHPLKKGRVDVSGVTYMGDGSWGIGEPRTPKRSRWFLAQSASVSQFILVTLEKERRVTRAITSSGCVIDQMEQHVTH